MGTSVLLVDDEPAILFAYDKILRSIGCEVDTAASKAEAAALLEKNRYDFAILDICLTSSLTEEGIELARHARKLDSGIKLIMITAYGSQETMKRALAAGVDHYLEKPISVLRIREIIEGKTISYPG